MTWQPIDTAPRNETRILLYVPKTAKGIHIGFWGLRWGKKDNQPIQCEAWWLDGHEFPFDGDPYLPTLWCPIPTLPENK